MPDRLYTPWRMKYILSNAEKQQGCVFCRTLNDIPEHDPDNFVLHRGQTCFAIMNIYPYNVGHIMVLPNTHVSTLVDMPDESQQEMMKLVTYFTNILVKILQPDGFNVGLNIGKAAGAGIGAHLHMHLVPRWNGDSNFMPVLGQTRVLPEELGETYNKIIIQIKQNPPNL